MALKKREVVHSTRIIGRKRIIVPSEVEKDCNISSSPFSTPSPKRRGPRVQSEGLNRLESLPQDLLVKILCKVTHDDLKQLILVSKYVNEAALIAKDEHFAYSTPRAKPAFRKDDDLEIDDDTADDREVLNAPMRRRPARSRIDFEKCASVMVDLFSSFGDW